MQGGNSENSLLKILGVGFGVAVTVGGTIGTGILRKPGPVAEQLGDPVLIMWIWLIVGIYALLGTLCTIELGTSIPRAGAWYVYARRAFGDYTGFMVGSNSWLGTCASLGFGAFTIGEYLALLFPTLQGHESWLAIALLGVMASMHWLGLALASSMQKVISFIKALGLVAFVLVCFIYGGDLSEKEVADFTAEIGGQAGWLGPLIFALLSVFYTYDGWNTAVYFTEEDRDPVRNLPRSMIGGVLLVIVIYMLCNWAIIYVVPMEVLAQSKLAAADAISLIFGPASAKYMTIFLMISILGIMNAQVMFGPRVIYSMARDGLFIPFCTKVNKMGTPAIAMPLTVGVSILMIMAGREVSGRLSDVATFFFVLGYISGFSSLLKLRNSEPTLPRPWKVPLYPWLPIGMLIISLLFLGVAAAQDLLGGGIALGVVIASYPFYLLIRRINRRPLRDLP